MKNNPRPEQPNAPVDQQPDEKAPVEQPGPIIIKSGLDGEDLVAQSTPVDIQSVLHDFRDDAGNTSRHYTSVKPLRITSILFELDQSGDVQTFDLSDAEAVRIVVNMEA